jgi:ATP-dependent Lon protease
MDPALPAQPIATQAPAQPEPQPSESQVLQAGSAGLQMPPPDLQPELQAPQMQSQMPSDLQAPPQQSPASPIPQTVSNGDNSHVNGDQPLPVSDSIQALSQKQDRTANIVSNVSTAEIVNVGNAAEMDHSEGASYDQIRMLGEKVENAHVPEELRKILNERVARLALIRSGAGFTSSTYILEYESTSRYINWVVGLPWDRNTQDILDLSKAREILNKNHYGLDALKERVLEYMASIILNVRNNGAESVSRAPIICFVGLAGTGKTTFAKSVAEALGRQFERIPFGGMADSRVLRGQSRFFPDAEPGAIVKKLVHAGSKNPVILLDELDRVTETARADIMGVLIELLDPEQNYAFTDHYVDYPFNLSNCLFVATANNTTSISTAVLDRLEIMQMPSYNDDEKIMIGKNYVLPKALQMAGLKGGEVAIDDAAWPEIVRPLGFDSGIRSLERAINTICRKTAELIVEGQAQNVQVNQQNVGQFVPQW